MGTKKLLISFLSFIILLSVFTITCKAGQKLHPALQKRYTKSRPNATLLRQHKSLSPNPSVRTMVITTSHLPSGGRATLCTHSECIKHQVCGAYVPEVCTDPIFPVEPGTFLICTPCGVQHISGMRRIRSRGVHRPHISG